MILSVESVTAQRTQLWDAGFRPIPILNHDARGPSPGKRPLGEDWRQAALKDPPFCLTIPAVSHALNSGILADGLRPIDIDIDDPAMAARVRHMALDRFGEAPIRMRKNSARCLILYRAAEGQPPKISITGTTHTRSHGCKVEVLGSGQQFVAFGTHDSGADLEWFPEAPGDIAADSLPTITEAGLMEFLTAVAEVIGADAPSKPNGKDHYAASEAQAEPLRIAAAVAAIPNNGPADWEAWNRIGMAIWHAMGGSAIGGEIFNEWSKRNASYSATETEERWKHYQRSPPTIIGAGTLFHLARHTAADAMEDAPENPDDPGWWHSLEHNSLQYQDDAEVAEVSFDGRSEPVPDLRDGVEIDPSKHWLTQAPLREWLIDQWIPIGYTTGLYGDGGIGKSLILQQLATSVSLGLPWMGLDARGGRAFAFMCEDDASELHRRQEGINRSYDVEMSNLENLRIVPRLGFDNLLMTFDHESRGKPTDLFAQICKRLGEFRPRLVVLDTLADIFGGNEINRAHARQFVQGIGGQIARNYACAVVIAAHPSASGLSSGSGQSGSTAWNNTFRSRLYITRPEDDDDGRLISRMKSNYAPKGGEITAKWQDGAFQVTALSASNAPPKIKPVAPLDWIVIDAIFKEIDRAWRAGDPWSSEPQTKKEGRFIANWAAIHYGVAEATVSRNVQNWLTLKFLRRALHDTKAKKWGLMVAQWIRPPPGEIIQ